MNPVPNLIDTVVYEGGFVRIGAFRCYREHPSFADTGPAQNCCFVFPRTAVEIQHEHESVFVANPNVVTFYNVGQPYRRKAISPEGDHCDWFGLDPGIVHEVVRKADPDADKHGEQPFFLSHGWTDASTYLLQRKLFARVSEEPVIEPLAVEETVIDLLERVVPASNSRLWSAQRHRISAYQRDKVHQIETILSRRADERITLRSIAREVDLSGYHVCRLFRRVTSKKLHHYRLQIRLRGALAAVTDTSKSLTDIALDAGFSSHSHFTELFRREFGETPSRIRAGRRLPAQRAIF
jgi:AraC family transcriptional regulator